MVRCGLCRVLESAVPVFLEGGVIIVQCPVCCRFLAAVREHRKAVSCNEAVHTVVVAYRFFRGQGRGFRVDLERHDWTDHYCFHVEG